MVEDITERKRLEDQLRRAQKMEAVGQLAGGVAHDFNNLLMVIQGYSEVMLARLDPAEPLRKNAEEIQKATERAASLTRQLLAFSRMQVLRPKILDLNAVLAEMGKMLPRLIREDIELRIVPGASLGSVKADQSQIEQVILNLLVNARDAMPRGGKLTIETASAELNDEYARGHTGVRPGKYAMLAVSDTGVGMDSETQAHIFEPFFTTKELGKGTGLGLATVYGIVKQSSGWIWVYSEVGKGTTFKIYLPQVDERVQPPESSKTRSLAPGGTETILVVEDQDSIRELTREFLKGSGYTMLEARDGSEALQLAERYKGVIDLLVTDVVMPKMGGRELAHRLSAVRPLIKVLYMSGYAENSAAEPDILDQNSVWLQKPFPLDSLLHKVREVLDAASVVGNLPRTGQLT
jgi:nitrogen-specific signal transduction histidine kinase/ActR/RegA family two-component response regulator